LTAWGSDINQHFGPDSTEHEQSRASRALRAAHTVIVDSDDIAAKCEALAGRPVRTYSLPLGIDTNLFRPGYTIEARRWRQKLSIPDHAKLLISMRAWSPLYNHHLILEAFSRARPHFQHEVVLAFRLYNAIHYDSRISAEYERGVRDRVTALGLDGAIRWMEETSYQSLPEVYACCDAIINYPKIDAFPVTFLEASACLKPVLTCKQPSYVGTFAERYFHMTEPEDIESLTRGLIQIVNDDEDKGNLIGARDIVVQLYSQDRARRKLLTLYEELPRTGTSAENSASVPGHPSPGHN
jgi:glycosyltransferase involved in cell wall biosynthesis